MRFRFLSLLTPLALLALPAQAVVIPFENLAFTNTSGNPGQQLVGAPGAYVGTLTAITADFVMNSQSGGAWASDLGVFVTNQTSVDLASNGGSGLTQVGGFNTFGSADYSGWGMGDSSTAGTSVTTTITLANAIAFDGTASDPSIFLAYLWNSDSTGVWSGSITLEGLSVVPEPSTYALLVGAFAGLVVLRRRRKAS